MSTVQHEFIRALIAPCGPDAGLLLAALGLVEQTGHNAPGKAGSSQLKQVTRPALWDTPAIAGLGRLNDPAVGSR